MTSLLWLLLQVSSINRVLRNLASTSQKNEFNPYMDKFGLLNSQGWPRPNPWYANPVPTMHHPLGYNPQFSQPSVPSPTVPTASPHSDKKGEFASAFKLCSLPSPTEMWRLRLEVVIVV